ncbi:MAG: hypothetical protein M1816_005187 [Peltula sp. TS41687]|nr:MAG: hypothetical protein M1816_005187 [Peltula sp. TS41687]
MASSDSSVPTLKILLIGPSGVGKSALLIRYCDGLFDSESSTATIGVDFKTKLLSVHSKPYRLHLLDTAGQERFRTLSNSYYRHASGILVCYDLSNRESFAQMDRWFDEAETNTTATATVTATSSTRGTGGEGQVKFFLVATKADKARAVSAEEGEALAARRGCVGFAEVSAKADRERDGVRGVFARLVESVVSDEGWMGSSRGQENGRGAVGLGRGGGEEDGAAGGCAC